ncbi:MAG: lipoprotein [Gammaproteobacteria bacterium]|nr:lipoprotein [Gammaproteobacteria bacterium]
MRQQSLFRVLGMMLPVVWFGIVLGVGACGKKGPLYLPQHDAEQTGISKEADKKKTGQEK